MSSSLGRFRVQNTMLILSRSRVCGVSNHKSGQLEAQSKEHNSKGISAVRAAEQVAGRKSSIRGRLFKEKKKKKKKKKFAVSENPRTSTCSL